MNKIALPSDMGIAYLGVCDDCEVNTTDMCQGYGVYYREVCYHCCYLDRISKPLTKGVKSKA